MSAPTTAARASLAFACLIAGAAAIAFAPLLVRLADVSPTASAFWRVALAAPVLALWAGASPPQAPLSPFPWRALLLAGIFFAADLGVWHLSIAYTSVANATLEANLAPLFVVPGAFLLWQQRPRKAFVAALALALVGAALLIGPHVPAGGRALAGDALGVLTALFYAGYMLALKTSTGAASTARVMAVSTAVAATALLPYALATADAMLPAGASGWAVLAALALICQVGGQSLIAFGFAHLPASLSSLALLAQPVLASLYAWALLDEPMSAAQIAGGVLVLAGIQLARRSA